MSLIALIAAGYAESLALALSALLVGGGLWTLGRRYAVAREWVGETVAERTLGVSRALFWRRIFTAATALATYLLVAQQFFGLSPAEALAALPNLALQGATQALVVVALLGANFLLFFGPFLLFAKMGKETYEPGDASWSTKISDVRGQKAAVAEMERLLRLFDSGRRFVAAGGKRERGALLIGPPGTGKTMLAKAIASSLSMPIIIASGSSFGGIFFGMDAIAVYMMMRTARKKAKRWGGCVIFIDEIDALAQRRGGMGSAGMGGMGGMMGGGNMGLNMLLTQMDGVDSPGFLKKLLRRFLNVSLDGLFVPRSLGRLSLRLPPLRPPRYNLFFLGATNRPSVLDEAVTRPGRFGRSITFRTPTREARKDIAALYFDQKAHDPELDSPQRREEFARITEGRSPAEIEQVLSLALVYAFEDSRAAFSWPDVRTAIVNVEAGLAEAVEYTPRDALAVARHELGHAVCARFFEPERSSVRLSVRMRAGSLGHHYNIAKEEEFVAFRSQLAGRIRVGLGALAAERVFYGENTSGVSMDLIQTTSLAAHMAGIFGMGTDAESGRPSPDALRFGESLISHVEAGPSALETSPVAAVLGGPSREVVARIMGAGYIQAWRLIYANQEAIDAAAVKLIAAGELVGDEVEALLDAAKLKLPTRRTPFPPSL